MSAEHGCGAAHTQLHNEVNRGDWGVRPAGGSRALLEAPASHAEWLADAATVFPVNGVSADEQ